MSATSDLHRLLNERHIDWWMLSNDVTQARVNGIDVSYCPVGERIVAVVTSGELTPPAVVEWTLGRGVVA